MALFPVLGAAGAAERAAPGPGLLFVCRQDNDLFRVVADSGARGARVDRAEEAVERAPPRSGLLLLADGYPKERTRVPPGVLERARAKSLRLYIEFPAARPGLRLASPRTTRWERAVVASKRFAPAVERLRLLAIHDCHFLPSDAAAPDIALARVAGYDTAVFGLPEDTVPILFGHGDDVLVATTKLSAFVTERYGPPEAWRAIWTALLQWLLRGQDPPDLRWQPTVRPAYRRDQALPHDAERQALQRGLAWFDRSRLLLPTPDDPAAAGTRGFYEGYSSVIRLDGSQPPRRWRRNDCIGETAMAYGVGSALGRDNRSASIAANLMAYIHQHSPFAQGPRADPESPSFGLLSWGTGRGEGIYYGDDNARSLLGQMAAAGLLDTDRWDRLILRCILANFRTSGRLGFRGNALNEARLQRHGWRHVYQASTVNYAPHYECYLWACYLWAYRHTGYDGFLSRAKTAIAMTMAAYPDRWRWTNGIQQERARMLLPLAWLVRVEDTPEHRRWLRRLAEDLMADQVDCGAIREELGPAGRGTIPPPGSNADYGKHEAPIIQENGDPACDLLYTGGFALLGLHEAAAATGEALYAQAEDRLAKFLCRIQVRSDAHRELDGAWFRAFDFERWAYWGSNADSGWGAWCIETGWKQAWIVAILGLRQMDTSLWDLTAKSTAGRHFDELHKQMLPDGDDAEEPPLVEHLARGKPVSLGTAYDRRYPASGDSALTDGLRAAAADHRDPAWQGTWEHDLEAIIDLGEERAVQEVRVTFLQSTSVGIFLPARVEFATSADGKTFRAAATVASDVPTREPGPLIEAFAAALPKGSARFIRVRAKSLGRIPQWHPAAGKKAWLFVDEVVVR